MISYASSPTINVISILYFNVLTRAHGWQQQAVQPMGPMKTVHMFIR